MYIGDFMEITVSEHVLYIKHCELESMDALFDTYFIAKKMKYHLYMNSHIIKNDTIQKRNFSIHYEDCISITLPKEYDDVLPDDIPLDIVYEDALFLIVNKPCGLLVHSDGVEQMHTLLNRIKAYYLKQGIIAPVRPIHRLDKDTSGLLMVCKLPFFQSYLDRLLQAKKIARVYLAIVEGQLDKKEYRIEKNIARDRHNAKKQRVSKDGSYAYTTVLRRKVFSQYTLVECRLKTGRTHQIRVHLASIQHPIISDSLYGQPSTLINRCALHAWMLNFYHPLYQKQMEVRCEMPADMLKLIKG